MSVRSRRSATASLAPLEPGEHLRVEIKRLGLNQVAVSHATGVSRQSVNNIINGRQPISRAMAGKLARLTGRSSDYWLQSSFPPGARRGKDSGPPITGVGILVNHQIVRAVKDGIIAVKPFDETHVQPACLDLTLDDSIITATGRKRDITGGKYFLLKSGRAVNVRTREQIELPTDYIARAGASETVAKHGIVASHGIQIAPGFKGRLQFLVFNAGTHDFKMRAGDRLISLELMPLSAKPLYGAKKSSGQIGKRPAAR